MKRKDEIEYFDNLWRKMRRSLKHYQKTEAAEDLHHFRVQVKKLRAFITLAESDDRQGKLKLPFKPVKKIFSKAGEIRSADLTLQITRANSPSLKFINQQTKQRDKAIEQFKPFVKKKLGKLKEIKQQLHKKIRPISNVHINLFYLENLKQLSQAFRNVQFDESLHTSRKQLKVLLYNYRLVSSNLNVEFNNDYIDKVQETIGNWHDNEDAKALFKKERLPLTALNKKDMKLQAEVKSIVQDMYNRATTVTDVALPQVS